MSSGGRLRQVSKFAEQMIISTEGPTTWLAVFIHSWSTALEGSSWSVAERTAVSEEEAFWSEQRWFTCFITPRRFNKLFHIDLGSGQPTSDHEAHCIV